MQISFTLNNGNVPNTIYMPTTDPSVNKITLLISSDTTLTLRAGTPVPESEAAGSTGSLFYLHIKNLGLSQAELQGLSVSMDGWTTKVFADTQAICLTPAEDKTIDQGQMLTASLGNFIASKAPSGSSAQLYMSFYRASPVSRGSLPFTYNTIVTIQAPPSGKLDLHDALSVTLSENTVVQSSYDYPGIKNTLHMTFGPGQNPKVVNAGPNTVFTINFVYADDQYGYGALTTISDAFKIQVNAGDRASAWTITPPPEGSQNPGWLLQPPDGQPILGTSTTVDFVLSQILTRFQAGPTLMIVSYSKVPGYQDGAFSIVIYKEAHVYILSFLASPNPAVLEKGKASIDLSWTASPSRLTLMPGQIDVSGQSVHSTKIGTSTQFTLIAQGKSTSNYASSDVQVDIFPVINSMAASPQNVYYKDFPHDVLLDWSVNSNDDVKLINSLNSNVQSLPPNYTTGVNVTQPQMFSIIPNNSDLPLFIERNQVISAFQLQQQTVRLNNQPLAIALSPTANICAVVQKGSNQILVLETITNTPYGTPVSAGNQPAALAFSHDGRRFFVANGDSTLSVFDVTFSSASSGYSFTKVVDVTLSAAPVALGVSADDSTIFVISNSSGPQHLLAAPLGGSATGTLDVVKKDPDDDNYQVVSSVGFNQSVNAIAVLPSAAQVFVISTAAQRVFVVGYDSIDGSYQLVGAIDGFDSKDKPVDIGIAGHDAGTLLIVCSGTDSVYAVNKDVRNVAGKQKLSVGKSPARVLVIESGAYAYVSNSGDKTLSLIACFKGSGLCSILEKDLANKATPTALTSSAKGSLIYVANADSSLSVWNSSTFAPSGSKLSVGQPTNVAASTVYVASWHNYNVQISQGTPSPGLKVYNRNTQTTTLVNNSTKYTTFRFWPDDSQNLAIATLFNDQNLYILETRKFSNLNNIAFSGSPKAQAVSTTISPFGNMIFVLSKDTGGVYSLVAISCDLAHNTYKVVANINLFTQAVVSSFQSLAAVSDGSSVFITDGNSQKLYIVSREKSGGYSLESKSYSFIYSPRAINCAPDDTQLYIWMNFGPNSAFARFDIANRVLENFVLPGAVTFNLASMTISPDGSRLYVVDTNFGVRVFSTDAMQNVENITLPADASLSWGIAIAPDGSSLFTANIFSDNISLIPQLAAAPSRAAKLEIREALLAGGDYQGLFLRKYIGQKPTDGAGSGWTWSPDIQPSGVKAMPDPSQLGQQANYNTDFSQNVIITLGQYNNVYVRGLNTAPGAQKSRIYFYWIVPSVVQIPSSWSPYNFELKPGVPQNWLDLSAQKQGDIAYSLMPLSWKPDPANPHYCLVAWVDNSADPSPPDLSQWSNFRTWDDVGTFIVNHPNMAWRNTNDVTVAGQFMNARTQITGVLRGGDVLIGVKTDGIPTDGSASMQFTVINSNGSISYNSPNVPIRTNTVSQTISWPENAPNPVLTYTYTPPNGKLQGGEKITAFAGNLVSLALKKRLLLRSPESLIEVSRPGRLGSTQFMILGTVTFNYIGK